MTAVPDSPLCKTCSHSEVAHDDGVLTVRDDYQMNVFHKVGAVPPYCLVCRAYGLPDHPFDPEPDRPQDKRLAEARREEGTARCEASSPSARARKCEIVEAYERGYEFAAEAARERERLLTEALTNLKRKGAGSPAWNAISAQSFDSLQWDTWTAYVNGWTEAAVVLEALLAGESSPGLHKKEGGAHR